MPSTECWSWGAPAMSASSKPNCDWDRSRLHIRSMHHAGSCCHCWSLHALDMISQRIGRRAIAR